MQGRILRDTGWAGEKGVVTISQTTLLEVLALVQIELLLFAAVFFAIGLVDELAIDIAYVWFRLTARARTHQVPKEALPDNMLSGMAAVFTPA